MNPECCGKPTRLTDGREIYPRRPSLAEKKIYVCDTCKAYVGCHPGTIKPLGKPANAETRIFRKLAHLSFDELWYPNDNFLRIPLARKQAYAWLAKKMGRDVIHIGELTADECREVIRICAEYWVS